MPVIPNEVVVGVLTDAVLTVGHRLATASNALRSRRYKEELELVRWFETYRLLDAAPNLPGLSDGQHQDSIVNALRSESIDAMLHELLAVRLTDAPQLDADRVKESWNLTWARILPEVATGQIATSLFDYYDGEICTLVGRLEGAMPEMLPQIRAEAFSARIVAILHAIERHTAALTSQPNPDAEAAFINQYKRHVIQHHGQLEPPDFQRRRRIPISDIYVPPSILVMPVDDPETRAISLWKFARGIDRTVLLGDPGGGKTTAAQVLMNHYATQANQRIPFLVTLREFATQSPPERSVVEHIEHVSNTFYQCPAPTGSVTRLLLSGNAMVIFDGLDELVDTSRRAEITAIVEQFSIEYPLTPILVTSRLVGYDEARLDDQQFTIYRMGQFDEEQTAEYVQKWFAQEADIDASQAIQLSTAFMQESSEVPDLRSNPLMLALMCILYRGEGSIPRNRPEVYEQCATLLFRKWDARRRIHVELRARHLVEPALGYLAYWLFTRDQALPAVTERELVAETTEFLHDRGFESREEAADAAREFVEFCRGRAWVFSDAGTTATGQPLYTFTHRTFLEYFAAMRLSAICDTPEELARVLRPHIARQEWDVVAELSVQMKSDVIDRGAERIYTTLLREQRRRSSQGRSNILQFLGRCLKSAEPTPRVVRELTQAALNQLFIGDPNKPIYYLPLAAILSNCGTSRDTVADEIGIRIDSMVASSDLDNQLLGLHLAASIVHALSQVPARNHQISIIREADSKFWSAYQELLIIKHAPRIAEAARHDRGLMFVALLNSVITTEQVISWYGNLDSLFESCPMRIFGVTYISWMGLCIYATLGSLDEDFLEEGVWQDTFTAIGRHIIGNPHPPWANVSRTSRFLLLSPDRIYEPVSGFSDSVIFLAAATTFLILFEVSAEVAGLRRWKTAADLSVALGPYRDLQGCIEARMGVSKCAPDDAVAGLEVPEEFREFFRDWAADTLNFSGPS